MTTHSFTKKIAIILGGTNGIGKAADRLLLDKGASVHIVVKVLLAIGESINTFLIREEVLLLPSNNPKIM